MTKKGPKMRYYTYVEEPTLESYRLDYSPRDQLGTVLICPWVVMTGASGTVYHSMRALPLPDKQTTINFGTYRATGRLDEPGELVYSFRDFPAVERFRSSHTPDSVVYESGCFRFEEGVSDYRWTEAGGAVDLTAVRLGQACTFWVPQQPGFPHPVLSRSHLGKVTGTVNADPVEGIFMVDHIYSRPELSFRETRFTTHLHHYWMNWLVEYDDGSLEGGFSWRGQPGTDFSAAHHVVDGVSHARTDARLDIARTDHGTMQTLTLSLGDDLTARFDQHSSTDWPIHTLGTVAEISRDKTVVKSWNLSENFPINWGLVEDYQAAYAALYGRYPSLRRILETVTVVDGRLSVPHTPSAQFKETVA
jgi:hypothetical protein